MLLPSGAVSGPHNHHELFLQDAELKFHQQRQKHKEQTLELPVLYRHFLTAAYQPVQCVVIPVNAVCCFII